MNVSTAASNARAHIAEKGWWTKGGTPGVGSCIVQAVFIVTGCASDHPTKADFGLFHETCQEIRETLGFTDPLARLDYWNDAPGRTQAEVLDVLQRTAIRTDPVQALYVPQAKAGRDA